MVTGLLDVPDPVARCQLGPLPTGGARAVLEGIVLEALQRPPCVIKFSGGRDSSVLLAVATHVARREGLPPPIAFTFRYDGEPATEESEWQELVVQHLGVEEWDKAVVGSRNDMIGELAQTFLLSHGLTYPATLYHQTLPLERARGGTLISGEGGDEIFGTRRATIGKRVMEHPAILLRRSGVRALAMHAGPRRVREALMRKRLEPMLLDCFGYLKPKVTTHVIDEVVAELVAEPFDNTKSLGWHLRRKLVVKFQESATAYAAEYDVRHLDPLLEPLFVAAYARMVKPFGFATRTDALRALFADILPDPALSRTSKALFNRGYLTDVGRAFATSWQGGGVDPDIVDVEALRSAWLSEWPPAQCFWLLQSAWLYQNAPQAASPPKSGANK